MQNPFVKTAVILGAVFAILTTYHLIVSIGAILGGMFIGSVVTFTAMKKPRALAQGDQELMDLQDQIDISQ